MISKTSFLFALLASMLSILHSEPVVINWHSFSFHDARSIAQDQQKPLLIFAFQPGDKASKRLETETWAEPDIVELLNQFFVPNKIVLDQKVQDDRLRKWLASEQAVSTLIYHPSGYLMGRVDGFASPKTMKTILMRYVDMLQPEEAPAPVLSLFLPEISNQEDTHTLAMGSTRGGPNTKEVSFSIEDVPGLEIYSLQNFIDQEGSLPDYTLWVTSLRHIKKLSRKIKKLKRFWRGDIFVFEGELNGLDEKYHIVLGSFASSSKAKSYQTFIDDYNRVETEVIDLSRVLR